MYNDKWAALASTSLKQVNKMELSVLDAMHWNTNVSYMEFIRILEKVEAWVARDSIKKRGFCTYNETAVLLSRISLISDCVKPLMISLAAFTFVYYTAVVSLLVSPQIAISASMQRKFFFHNVKLYWVPSLPFLLELPLISSNLIKNDVYVQSFASTADNMTEQRKIFFPFITMFTNNTYPLFSFFFVPY
ncbi:unnamed protein product [Onchocerca flexuosa]|uniref:Glucuronosyltransferase n=1 Tax=Onchocerca flexuosa TaxID=387005 RepID=A0A183HIV9_9BILA|nr:unnamed protein product [Onchocerca flexuosa]